MQDFLVGPSVAPCNGHIADGRIKWEYPLGRRRYFAKQNVLVSPSAGLCNGNIADEHLKWGYPFRELRVSRYMRRNRIRVFQIEADSYRIESINCGKASLPQRISEH